MNTLRFDGLYQTDFDKKEKTRGYLRFYPEGSVISVTVFGNSSAAEIFNWFNIPFDNQGSYYSNGVDLSFTIVSPLGKVFYIGKIENEDNLLLKTKSLINGYEAMKNYSFIEVVGYFPSTPNTKRKLITRIKDNGLLKRELKKRKKIKSINLETFLDIYEPFIKIPNWTKEKHEHFEEIESFLSKYEMDNKVVKPTSKYNLCEGIHSFTILKVSSNKLGKLYNFRNEWILVRCAKYVRWQNLNEFYRLDASPTNEELVAIKKRFGHWFILNNNSN